MMGRGAGRCSAATALSSLSASCVCKQGGAAHTARAARGTSGIRGAQPGRRGASRHVHTSIRRGVTVRSPARLQGPTLSAASPWWSPPSPPWQGWARPLRSHERAPAPTRLDPAASSVPRVTSSQQLGPQQLALLRTEQGLDLVGLQVPDEVPLHVLRRLGRLLQHLLRTRCSEDVALLASCCLLVRECTSRRRPPPHLDVVLAKHPLPGFVCLQDGCHWLRLAHGDEPDLLMRAGGQEAARIARSATPRKHPLWRALQGKGLEVQCRAPELLRTLLGRSVLAAAAATRLSTSSSARATGRDSCAMVVTAEATMRRDSSMCAAVARGRSRPATHELQPLETSVSNTEAAAGSKQQQQHVPEGTCAASSFPRTNAPAARCTAPRCQWRAGQAAAGGAGDGALRGDVPGRPRRGESAKSGVRGATPGDPHVAAATEDHPEQASTDWPSRGNACALVCGLRTRCAQAVYTDKRRQEARQALTALRKQQQQQQPSPQGEAVVLLTRHAGVVMHVPLSKAVRLLEKGASGRLPSTPP